MGDGQVEEQAVRGWRRSEGWGWVWGDDDQVGALNAMTEETVLAALRGVTQGRAYDLGVTLAKGSFVAPVHASTEVVAYRTPHGLFREGLPGFDDPSGVSFNTSVVILSDHAGTQIDGLCHATFGADHHWYNGFRDEEHGRDFGPERAGAQNIPPIIADGVLIDVPRAKGLEELEPSTAIGPDDLEAALDAQGADVRPGDVVLVRTGAMRHWGEAGTDHERIAGPNTAGLSLAGARWLTEEKGAMLIGADNSTVEVVPPVDGDNASPVHKYLLVDQGVHMGEHHYLEDLSADGVSRFCYIALVPKVRGTTAGFALRPLALV